MRCTAAGSCASSEWTLCASAARMPICMRVCATSAVHWYHVTDQPVVQPWDWEAMKPRARFIHQAHPPCNTQHPACNKRHVADTKRSSFRVNVQHPTCRAHDVQHTARSTRHAAHDVQHAACRQCSTSSMNRSWQGTANVRIDTPTSLT